MCTKQSKYKITLFLPPDERPPLYKDHIFLALWAVFVEGYHCIWPIQVLINIK